jgi:hypothetical protein
MTGSLWFVSNWFFRHGMSRTTESDNWVIYKSLQANDLHKENKECKILAFLIM